MTTWEWKMLATGRDYTAQWHGRTVVLRCLGDRLNRQTEYQVSIQSGAPGRLCTTWLTRVGDGPIESVFQMAQRLVEAWWAEQIAHRLTSAPSHPHHHVR